jgi:hypothetical protein
VRKAFGITNVIERLHEEEFRRHAKDGLQPGRVCQRPPVERISRSERRTLDAPV